YLFHLKAHYERLLRSCRTLMIDLKMSADDLCDLTIELMRRNDARYDIYVRPLAYKDSMELGPRVNIDADALTIYTRPLGNYLDTDKGLKACVSSWTRIEDNAAPARAKITGIYINSALARTEAELNGFDEAIMLSSDGHVSEGSAENLFVVDNGALVTPPGAGNILVGITRASIITLAHDLDIPVIERQIDRSELYGVSELFLCGTGAQISPVTSVDHRPIGDGAVGPITRRLQEVFFKAVRGKLPEHRDWCTPVYAGARTPAATH
ncbi:MAG: branched-chain amino acid transaminase, partial [Chloroflexota bacterium]|nr:branched-chain amino acid transaminase [Chloroflexota bacterium]